MNSQDLKEALQKELINLFNNKTSTNNPKVYIDDLPVSKFKGQEQDIFPFVLIEVEGGEIPVRNGENLRNILLTIGVDNSNELQAKVEVIASYIINYVLNRRYIDDLFELTGEKIEVAYGKDEGLSPYKYGVIKLTFLLPNIENGNVDENILL